MTPLQTIQLLYTVGQRLTEVDVPALLSDPACAELRGEVRHALADLSLEDLQEAVAALRSKRQELLRGRKVSELPPEDLDAYGTLLDTENLLVQQELEVGLDPQFLTWMREDAWPVLRSTAPLLLVLL